MNNDINFFLNILLPIETDVVHIVWKGNNSVSSRTNMAWTKCSMNFIMISDLNFLERIWLPVLQPFEVDQGPLNHAADPRVEGLSPLCHMDHAMIKPVLHDWAQINLHSYKD